MHAWKAAMAGGGLMGEWYVCKECGAMKVVIKNDEPGRPKILIMDHGNMIKGMHNARCNKVTEVDSDSICQAGQ